LARVYAIECGRNQCGAGQAAAGDGPGGEAGYEGLELFARPGSCRLDGGLDERRSIRRLHRGRGVVYESWNQTTGRQEFDASAAVDLEIVEGAGQRDDASPPGMHANAQGHANLLASKGFDS
jgi:hypothetical protein